jgi:hypothetical protein
MADGYQLMRFVGNLSVERGAHYILFENWLIG